MCFGGTQSPAAPVQPAPAPAAPSPLAVQQDPSAPARANEDDAYGTSNGGMPNLMRSGNETPVGTPGVTAGGTGLAM